MTISILVVDDDPVALSIHCRFVERLRGFEVVGQATSVAQARELVGSLQPDLVLLDMYLPDGSGIQLVRALRAEDARIDVIAVTAAKDVAVVRDALRLGVVHYIVKPFTFTTFRERLASYASARERLIGLRHAEQHDVDRLYGLLRTSGDASLPKGISAPTLERVTRVLRSADTPLAAAEVASRSGISRPVARRYLRFLADSGAVDLSLRYGVTGRPEHLYRWEGPRELREPEE